jgi:hypothetical protein
MKILNLIGLSREKMEIGEGREIEDLRLQEVGSQRD